VRPLFPQESPHVAMLSARFVEFPVRLFSVVPLLS